MAPTSANTGLDSSASSGDKGGSGENSAGLAGGSSAPSDGEGFASEVGGGDCSGRADVRSASSPAGAGDGSVADTSCCRQGCPAWENMISQGTLRAANQAALWSKLIKNFTLAKNSLASVQICCPFFCEFCLLSHSLCVLFASNIGHKSHQTHPCPIPPPERFGHTAAKRLCQLWSAFGRV